LEEVTDEDHLLGAPGAGKGTVAKLLSDYDGSVQISTGDILRQAVKEGTPLGMEAKGYMDRGELVPDELILKLMAERLRQPDCARGFILDGFPRTIPQAEALKKMLQELGIALDMVVNLEVPREVILDRLTTRRTCSNPSCQEIYNIKSNPPNPDGTCKNAVAPRYSGMMKRRRQLASVLPRTKKRRLPLLTFTSARGCSKPLCP